MTSRFSLTNAPVKEPGVCWITKSGVGPFIDTGVDLSLHVIDRGRIYLSVDAIREMAQIAGLFDEKEPVTVELKKKQWYDKGYNDAIKEMSGDAVNRFIEHVSRNTVGDAGNAAIVASEGYRSTAGAAIPGPADFAAGAPEVDQEFGGSELEGASVGSVKRSASVSTDSGDESQYRL